MKIRILAILLSLIVSSGSFACIIPYSGPEYDALIVIKKLNADNFYSVSFPTSVNSSKGLPDYYLSYSSDALGENCIVSDSSNLENQKTCWPLDSYNQDVNLKNVLLSENKTIVNAEFELSIKEGYAINVVWPGLCSSYASSIISQ